MGKEDTIHTTDDVVRDCKQVIEQIIKLEEEDVK